MAESPRLTRGSAVPPALAAYVVESALAMTIVDREGWILESSHSCAGQLRTPRAELVGRNAADVTSDGAARFLAHLASETIAEPMTFPPAAIQHEDGSVTWLQSSCSPWRDDKGQIGGVVVVIQNMTAEQKALDELRRAEDERQSAYVALKAALAEAEEANRAKSVFLATMSHEIRTPLNGVLGMAQAIARDELSPVQRQRLEVVRASGEALLAILGDLLDISKIEAGKLELEIIEFDLTEAAEGASASFSGLAAAKNLDLVTDVGQVAGTYLGDPTRLRQILSNLISNAIKFTETGGVSLTARPTDEGKLEFRVADTGPGIPAAALDRLFEKFVQADSSTTRRYGGTGLGLAICRELTELMGGSIRAESEVGCGTSFIVTLPLERTGEVRVRAASEPPPTETLPSLRILAAEDNQVNQIVLKTILEQMGFEVALVADGAQAVEAFRKGGWDVVLMDVQMPIMDGLAATRAIRELERKGLRPRTPIIALTANAMEHQKDEYLTCEMDRLVAKPIQIEELLAAIKGVVEDLEADKSSTPQGNISPTRAPVHSQI